MQQDGAIETMPADPYERVHRECRTPQGVKHGPFVTRDRPRRTAERGRYDHGQLQGEWKQWYGGKLESVGNYRDGKRSGRWRTYDQGRLFEEKHYQHDELSGPYAKWCTSRREWRGRLEERGVYKNGKRHGVWRSWECWDPANISEVSYRDGVKHGPWAQHSPSGVSRGTHTDGALDPGTRFEPSSPHPE